MATSSGDWGADLRPCHDCGVIKGQFHVEGCDVERCIACDCSDEEQVDGRFDFQAHKEKALSAYLLQRPLYEEACLVAKNILKRAIERSGIKLLPKYSDPLTEITDLGGVRIITFFPDAIATIDKIISDEFYVMERSDKGEKLQDEERFGYQSIHYLVNFSPKRTVLAEYARYAEIILELQVRTILQHAWAEIEHDIQYKSTSVIPREINRRFNALAGMLEIADREFQAVQDEDNRLRQMARQMIKEGEIDEVEITPDALKTFLAKTMGVDQRIRWSSYDYLARALRKCGFKTLRQLEDCMRGYDDDELSQLIYGFRQGQILRCELVLLASMGELFVSRHPWAEQDWFQNGNVNMLSIFRANNIEIRNFDPLAMS